jgi:hypothetical protein
VRIERHADTTKVVLSRRNVEELYAQLDRLDEERAVGLHKRGDGYGEVWHLVVEDDATHYGDTLNEVEAFNFGRGRK